MTKQLMIVCPFCEESIPFGSECNCLSLKVKQAKMAKRRKSRVVEREESENARED